jgi:hypothetical protein
MAAAAPPDARGAKRGRGAPLRCVVCYEREITIMASPCKCACLCTECAAQLAGQPCVRCRAPVTEHTRIYIAYDDDDHEGAPPPQQRAAAAAAPLPPPAPAMISPERASELVLALTADTEPGRVALVLSDVVDLLTHRRDGELHLRAEGLPYTEELLRAGAMDVVLAQACRDIIDINMYASYILEAMALLPATFSAQVSSLRAGPRLLHMARVCVQYGACTALWRVLRTYVTVMHHELREHPAHEITHAQRTLEAPENFGFVCTDLRTCVIAHDHGGTLRAHYVTLLCLCMEHHSTSDICEELLVRLLGLGAWSDATSDTVRYEIAAARAAVRQLRATLGLTRRLDEHSVRMLKFACAVLALPRAAYQHRDAAYVLAYYVNGHDFCAMDACTLREARVLECIQCALPYPTPAVEERLYATVHRLSALPCARAAAAAP